jgi:FkbM family methyltransferase
MNNLKQMISGTCLESPARFAVNLMRKVMRGGADSEWDVRLQRDEKLTDKLLGSLLRSDSNCIDIGANQGDFLARFCKLSPSGHHLAFEPLPEFYKRLVEKFPEAEVHNCALSDFEGTSEFHHVVEMPGMSGLKGQPYPDKVSTEMIQVNVRRLDEMVKPHVNVDFIKIDVEGAELEVIKGGRETISRCKPVIYFEHAKIHNLEYETSPEVMFDLMTDQLGFTLFTLAMDRPLSKSQFVEIYEQSFALNYDRKSHTNFLAMPAK